MKKGLILGGLFGIFCVLILSSYVHSSPQMLNNDLEPILFEDDFNPNYIPTNLSFLNSSNFKSFSEGGDSGPSWPDFSIKVLRPFDSEILQSEDVLIEFELEDGEDFEGEVNNSDMEFCQIFALRLDDELVISPKFSENNFQPNYNLQMTEGDYSLLVYCKHPVMGNGASVVSSFSIVLPEITENAISQEEEEIVRKSSGSCVSNWVCGEWSACLGGEQFRSCVKEIEVCYANPSEKPLEVQSCIVELEPLSLEINQGALARITGAVVGAMGKAEFWGVFTFLLLVIAGAIFVRVRNFKKE